MNIIVLFFSAESCHAQDSEERLCGEGKLSLIAEELLKSENIIIGFACFNLGEIYQINDILNKAGFSLSTVFIPSKKRIQARKAEAIEHAKVYGRWIGSSEQEVNERFVSLQKTIQEIIDGLRGTSIVVKEV